MPEKFLRSVEEEIRKGTRDSATGHGSGVSTFVPTWSKDICLELNRRTILAPVCFVQKCSGQFHLRLILKDISRERIP